MYKIVGLIVLFAMLFTGCLVANQQKFCYFPNRYPGNYREMQPPGTVELNYEDINGTRQVAFYVPPKSPLPPGQGTEQIVWVLCPGNTMRALDWSGFVNNSRNTRDGFLLVDYPGFGLCGGEPNRASIAASYDSAWLALQEHLNTCRITPRPRLLGWSMGAAVALEFATRHKTDRIILTAPFTSMNDIANKIAWWPVGAFMTDRYDSIARLQELSRQPQPPTVFIFHNDGDEIIPVRMAHELQAAAPGIVRLTTKPGGNHGNVLDRNSAGIHRAMSSK